MEPNKPNQPTDSNDPQKRLENPVAGNAPRRPQPPQGVGPQGAPAAARPVAPALRQAAAQQQQRQAAAQMRPPRPGQPSAPKPAQPQPKGAPVAGAAMKATKSSGGGGSRRRRQAQSQVPSHTDLVPSLDTMPVNKSVFNGAGGTQQSKRQSRGPANQVSNAPRLKIMPLGGLGEIGKNMTAVEYANEIIIMDMGFAFPDNNQPGVDYILPDVTYLERNRHKVKAIVITHGHMDHIGGSGYMIPKFPVPIYGSRLSLGMVAKQIEEFKIQTPRYVVMDPDKHEKQQVGSFGLELVRVTHTIADATAIVLHTPVGLVINTGDWRLDPTPLDGKLMDLDRLKQLGDQGVLLLMSDSTSCDKVGRGGSEKLVEPTIHDLFGRASGRIIISTFSSSITRVQLIIEAAAQSGRKLALVGRSMLGTIELCVKMGYLSIPQGLLIRAQDTGSYSDDQVVILCTGSQGEENSALSRMSTGDHQSVKIKTGDTVIFSSSVIPGNEVPIVTLIDNLMREGANVFARSTEALRGHGPVHVGGHASRDDVADLVNLVRPKFFMPIHGEFHHLVYNAEVAAENGVPKDNIFVMDNGDVLELTSTTAQRGPRIPAGMVMVDGAGVGDVEGVVLRDRIALGGEGVFMIVATVSRKTGRLVTSPDIISRGFIYMKEHDELINLARTEVRKAFEKRAAGGNPSREDWAKFKLRLRDDIGDLLYDKTKRNPMILPVINEI
ncbi:MAG TPA: ribonuclease J [Candidatus Saccharimonadia bacterium]|nr:ribonuclease J [Candidatus Saccharimonadia bacterium]